MTLNGEWDFAFDFGRTGREREFVKNGKYDKKINVPFCPESKLSGIEYKDFINACWYKRTFKLPADWDERTILHFEAVYYFCEVYINGNLTGSHKGGYTPFFFDITELLTKGVNTITVYAEGDARDKAQPSGKQSDRYNSHGCMYTRSTGIWQTVWLEGVSKDYLKSVKIDTDTKNKIVTAQIAFGREKGKLTRPKKVILTAFYGKKEVGKTELETDLDTLTAQIKLSELHLWNVGDPKLYDLVIETQSQSGKKAVDKIKTYFGMREIRYDGDCLVINGKKVFQRLVLDQGYYPDGIYTAPDEKDLKKDIELSLALGFNGARLHERVFERRFLYNADIMGYIVWGEYPNWGFDYTTDASVAIYLAEWMESVERDYNHPALIGWCPMNENWNVNERRQNDELLRTLYYETKRFDKTRPVIDVSWNFHVITDIFDTHEYVQDLAEFEKMFGKFEDGKVFDKFNQKYDGQPYFVSEYGGIKWPPNVEGWGYGDAPKTLEEFVTRYEKMNQILFNNPKVCAVCYTQLYDVEQEQNGLYYYDRSPKFDTKTMERLKKSMLAPAKIESI